MVSQQKRNTTPTEAAPPENPKHGEIHGDHKWDAETKSWVWKDEATKQKAWEASQSGKDKTE